MKISISILAVLCFTSMICHTYCIKSFNTSKNLYPVKGYKVRVKALTSKKYNKMFKTFMTAAKTTCGFPNMNGGVAAAPTNASTQCAAFCGTLATHLPIAKPDAVSPELADQIMAEGKACFEQAKVKLPSSKALHVPTAAEIKMFKAVVKAAKTTCGFPNMNGGVAAAPTNASTQCAAFCGTLATHLPIANPDAVSHELADQIMAEGKACFEQAKVKLPASKKLIAWKSLEDSDSEADLSPEEEAKEHAEIIKKVQKLCGFPAMTAKIDGSKYTQKTTQCQTFCNTVGSNLPMPDHTKVVEAVMEKLGKQRAACLKSLPKSTAASKFLSSFL
jgi:hypothetical protein